MRLTAHGWLRFGSLSRRGARVTQIIHERWRDSCSSWPYCFLGCSVSFFYTFYRVLKNSVHNGFTGGTPMYIFRNEKPFFSIRFDSIHPNGLSDLVCVCIVLCFF